MIVEIGKIILIILGAILLVCIIMFFVVKGVIDKIFSRCERPEYSVKLQFKDVVKDYPQELVKFPSGQNMLQGYLLGRENSKGLVVVVHGLGGGAEGYLTQILYFVQQGYQVFSYDYTGYHLSEGKNSVGLPQSVDDLVAALKFIENEERFAGLPVYLFGHSWGGYSVAAALTMCQKINAVASVSGFNNPNKMIKEWSNRMIGRLSGFVNPFMMIHQRLNFGKKLDILAADGINKAGIPVLVVHGKEDKTVRLSGSALFSCKEDIISPKVQYLLWEKEGQNGHLDILYSIDAMEYDRQIGREYEQLLKLTKKKLSKEDKKEFFDTVDKERTSVPNKELMEKIVEFFEQAV